MSPMQIEILTYLLHGWFLERDGKEFSYPFALRRKRGRGGIYYPSAPVLGLMKRGLVMEDDGRLVISPEGKQVAKIQ